MLYKANERCDRGVKCEVCSSRKSCEYVEASVRWECERRGCPKRNDPARCNCADIRPAIDRALDEFHFGKGAQ